MPSLLSRYQHDATAHRHLPLLLLTSSIFAYLGTSVQHSLLTSALAWLAISIYTSLRTNGSSLLDAQVGGKKIAWAAGGLVALGSVCERAVDGRGVWWAKGLLPAAIYIFLRSDLTGQHEPLSPDSPPPSPDKSRTPPIPGALAGSKVTLTVLTFSAVVATFASSGSNVAIALGLSYAITQALAFLLIERARTEVQSSRASGASIIYSANGLLSQPAKSGVSGTDAQMSVIRDVSLAAASMTAIAALSLESLSFGGLAYWGIIGQAMGDNWLIGQGILTILVAGVMIFVNVGMDVTALFMIQRQGSFLTSFVPLFAAVFSQLVVSFSFSRLWFAALCGATTFAFLDEQDTFSSGPRKRMRVSKILTLVATLSFLVLTVLYLREPYERARFSHSDGTFTETISVTEPPAPLAPKEFANTEVHPIDQLVRDAEGSWNSVLQSQSQSLEAAVVEYKRRYRIPPPPNFDKWYEFAKRKSVKLIDEYDNIYDALLPFWGLSPATIRARAREAIGYSDNMLMGLAIRDGKSSQVQGGPEWLQQAAVGMMEQFVQHLPDMDLAFNTHDEPRVVVPHDDLSRLVKIALQDDMPTALKNPNPKNAFSTRPKDVNSGKRFAETKFTRFNWYAHQPVWVPSRMSCAASSPARALDEAQAADNLTAYALGDLGFVYNHTAFSDICNSPSFSKRYGFFDRPNAFNLAHDLFPIFSQSKISSFQDILYPSPWYWYGKVNYEPRKDVDWNNKLPKLFWRGSTTGGFSRDGGWRRQHRQHMVTKINALDDAKIIYDASKDSGDANARPEYRVKEVPRDDYADSMDVHFSHVGQCDPGDCTAQREFFSIADEVAQQDQWKWRYLLDMDGNAFSGRFYAFLQSKSLVFKMSIFREWHEEWIKPWVHYVPLSLRGEEALEAVRYFSAEEEGKKSALRLANQGREWAARALRNEDFEVWFFRVLLEYGRLVDDNRAEIGYSGS